MQKKIMVSVRLDPEKKKELDIMLAHKGMKAQTFFERCLDEKLAEFKVQNKDD